MVQSIWHGIAKKLKEFYTDYRKLFLDVDFIKSARCSDSSKNIPTCFLYRDIYDN